MEIPLYPLIPKKNFNFPERCEHHTNAGQTAKPPRIPDSSGQKYRNPFSTISTVSSIPISKNAGLPEGNKLFTTLWEEIPPARTENKKECTHIACTFLE